MKYKDLRRQFGARKIFTITDLKVFGIRQPSSQLYVWSKNNDIIRVTNGVYVFAEYKKDISNLMLASKIYHPSYISLEYALNYYGLIPDIPLACTSITSKTTRTFHTSQFGSFIYRHINPRFYFGYFSENISGLPVFIADREKVLVDYFYFNSKIKDVDDFENLRINKEVVKEDVDLKKMQMYLDLFAKKYMQQIFKIFLTYIEHD